MSKKGFLIVFSLTAAILVMYAATEAVAGGIAETCSDTNNTYTVSLNRIESVAGKIQYWYDIEGKKSAIDKINRMVLVLGKPLEPGDITDPASNSVGEYCYPDSPTKINLGDCDSFPVSVEPQPGAATSIPFLIETTVQTQGTMTVNIITGTSGVETCISEDGGGIIGPGAIIDPNEPVDEDTKYSTDECTWTVQKFTNGAIKAVIVDPPCKLTVNGAPIGDVIINGRKMLFIPDGTTVTSSSSPPCYQYYFGGKWYEICS